MRATCECGCCAGITQATHEPAINRPRLPAIAYRIGTHATFFEAMLAALTTTEVSTPHGGTLRPLRGLTTRDPRDPAIAFLDAWATVADVLTFYQERLANEGYLRTATSRRSLLELARLVGYRPRPGVAASVYLAFTVDDGFDGIMPAGTRAQSIPGSGELPQFFETSRDLKVRDEWNAVKPRPTRPQAIADWNAAWIDTIYFAGMATKLKPQDPILIVWNGAQADQWFRRVKHVDVEAAYDRTRVTLQVDDPGFLHGLNYILALFQELQGTLGAVSSTAAAVFTGQTAVAAPVSARALADAVELLRGEAVTLAATSPGWGVALAGLAARLERLGTAYFPELPVTPSGQDPLTAFQNLLGTILRPAAIPPASPEDVATSPVTAFDAAADALPRLVAGGAWEKMYEAWSETTIAPAEPVSVYALRTRASLYGHNTPGNGPDRFTIVLNPDGTNFSLLALSVGSQNFVLPGGSPVQLSAGALLTLPNGTLVRVPTITPLRFEFEQAALSVVLTPTTAPAGWTVEVDGVTPSPVNLTFTSQGTGAKRRLDIQGELSRTTTVEQPQRLSLDTLYPRITPRSWIAVDGPHWTVPLAFLVERVSEETRADYGVAVRGTRLEFARPPATREWILSTDAFQVVRATTVYAESELLPLAEEPYREDVAGDAIAVDGLYAQLDPGRWLIVSGERSDVSTSAGMRTAERVMLAGVSQAVETTFNPKVALGSKMVALPGDTLHSTLRLATPLSYRYQRDTVVIHANVAKATHGQTVSEVLGNGDASRRLQAFTLSQRPLTHVAAPSASGIASTLVVRVDEVAWHETDSLVGVGPTERVYVTDVDDDERTSVVFGNGQQGTLVPTGNGNVAAVYRYGIGRAGNVAAERISQLASRPPGAKAVINPLRASGGAERDDGNRLRRNAPLAVTALDHLVSEHDYADFALTFAGIGKASAIRISDGRRQIVHVTIAGVDDIPIDPASDLHRALVLAFREHGDPYQPVEVASRTLKLLVVGAGVRIDPDHQWETVARGIRAALLGRFGFERRDLAQSAFASEAVSVIHGVAGVTSVDLELFDALAVPSPIDLPVLVQAAAGLQLRTHVAAGRARRATSRIDPAELVVIPPDLHDAIMVRKIS